MKKTKVENIWKQGLAIFMAVLYIFGVILAPANIVAASTVLPEETPEDVVTQEAASKNDQKEEAKIRFVFTTDLHGMVSSMDLIAGTDFANAGLSRAINLIRQTRNEVDSSNIFTFDIGDVLLDASTQYIYNQDDEVIQPIYQAMTLVGYDAITLGNHDFDYGKDYIIEQLNGSGLMDKVVVSNLMNFMDGSYPFARNMIIEREVTTNSGATMKVKVGIVGETIPTLSTKTENYAGIWETEDIVQNVAKESRLLKEQGADIIVVLAHSGFGLESYSPMDSNASYQLTLLEDVDVVLCGHEHTEFPNKDTTGEHYKLSGVDKTTGLVNGKVLVMAKNNAYSIGVADLTLGYNKDKMIVIKEKNGSVRRVADYRLEEDQEVLDCLSEWSEELQAYRTKELILLEDGVTIQNYLGVLVDTSAIQLQNNARIAYARRYVETLDRTYSGYPVIAAASHISYGVNGKEDYVNIKDSIRYADLFTLQNYRHMTYLYRVTGAQIKEWLELSASIYTDLSSNTSKTTQLINPDWMNNWANFYVFDGINYTINPYTAPRYNAKGNRINDTYRVSDITYNGELITDDMIFVVACNSLPSAVPMFSWAGSQQVRGAYRTQVLIAEYLDVISKLGAYSPQPDYNWSIDFKAGQKFTFLTSSLADTFVTSNSWYQKTLMKNDQNAYYMFQVNDSVQTVESDVIIAPGTNDPVMTPYSVYVDAFSDYGIRALKYSVFELSPDSTEWASARDIVNHTFSVYDNTTYYIYLEDNKGNKKVVPLVIDNIGSKDMAEPTVWSFNNRKTAVTGKGEAGATVVAVVDEKEYTSRVLSNGTFSLSIPSRNAGDVFYVYLRDDINNRQSEKVKVLVRRSGPNQLTVNKFYNNHVGITGTTNDENVVVMAVVDEYRKVFVPVGSKELLLKSSDFETENYSVIEVDLAIDTNGSFVMILPDLEIGTVIRLFNIDYLSRIGKKVSITVGDGGPYSPNIDYITNGERCIYGYVKSATNEKILTVTAVVGEKVYTATTNQYGYFTIKLNTTLMKGELVEVYASDTMNGRIRKGRITTIYVDDLSTLKFDTKCEVMEYVYGDKNIVIHTDADATVFVAIPYKSGTEFLNRSANQKGVITIYVNDELVEGAMIYATARSSLGTLIKGAAGQVKYRKPSTPVLMEEVTNKSTKIKLSTAENCRIVVQTPTTEYVSIQGVYEKETNRYIHTIPISKQNSKSIITVFSQNVTTKSDKLCIEVGKLAPDMPTVEMVEPGMTEIRGVVEIFLLDGTMEATLKNTKTKVFAKINTVNYQGVIQEDGTFVIQIPAITAEDKIKVFAYNYNGYGPSLVIQ